MSSRSVSVRPVRSVSMRHQHSKPQRRSSPIRSRGIPVPRRRSSPVSKSKKPSNTAAEPLRSGSPSRASTRMRHGVPGRMSSALRGPRPRPPRRGRRSRANASAGASVRSARVRGPRRSRLRAGSGRAVGRSGCAGACCGRGGPRRLPPRRRRCGRSGRGSSVTPPVWQASARPAPPPRSSQLLARASHAALWMLSEASSTSMSCPGFAHRDAQPACPAAYNRPEK